MPHYSDYYSTASGLGLSLPHYNYNYPSRYTHLYKPHLSTISELSLPPYRRLNHKIYKPDYNKPIKVINTADIDVSANKYRKFEKKRNQQQSSSALKEQQQNLVTKEATPKLCIKRDRPTVRLKTLHTDKLKEEIGEYKKWRDNFTPNELKEKPSEKKSKGELLKEKFLIRSRSKDNIKKTTSFREICDAITTNSIDIDDELNPGQPEEIQRRQSRQLSSSNLLEDIHRVSAELSPEDIDVLNAMLQRDDSINETTSDDASIRKESISSEDSYTVYEINNSNTNTENTETKPKNATAFEPDPIKNKTVSKSSERDLDTKLINAKKEENALKINKLKQQISLSKQKQIKDISKVEIEQIKFKPKQVITATSTTITPTINHLKAVVNQVDVVKKPKLKLNVSVRIENDINKNPIQKYTILNPQPNKQIINNVLLQQNTLLTKKSIKEKKLTNKPPKLTSKRSLIHKPMKEDPDLDVFNPPPTPEPPESSSTTINTSAKSSTSGKFVPLQSNRLSQWMHPFSKPEQYDECPVEIYAKPKWIKARHYPRGRKKKLLLAKQQQQQQQQHESDSDDEDTDDEEDDVEDEETSASYKSNDSGFGSTVVANTESRQCENVDSRYGEQQVEEFLTAVKNCGKIIPPATTIPRFKKYAVDDFDFCKVLGKGSFGKVLLAKLKKTEYYYAVKCLQKEAIVEDDDVECTLIERKVLALGTKHPFLCHLLCTFQTESHLFFVMEYLNGGDLMFHITTSGCFPEDQAQFYSAEIISGLQFLHAKGIIYRDLKLDNVILDFDGHVRLADFGMCKLEIFLDRMAESFCGTPDYMAPEIIKGQHYNQAVDWWSFGVLLYEMLLGQSPFSGCDEDELFWSICNEKPVFPKHLSTYAVDILKLLLEKDQKKRLGNRFSEHGPIREHNFYKSIDWAELEARKIPPPFKPDLVHPLDTQYFDAHFTKETVKLTATECPVLGTIDQSQFQGFSYTNPNACDR